MMTLTIDIPALDRLCGILEGAERNGIAQAIEDEIVRKLKAAAEGGVPRPKFEEVAPTEDHPWKDEAKATPEPRKPAQEPPKPGPANVPAETTAPAPVPAPATLEGIQRAAAQLRDQGKLGNITAMFGEFGIKRLSDLKPDQLPVFAERLRAMGAKV